MNDFEFQFTLDTGEQFTVPVLYDFDSLSTSVISIALQYADEDEVRLTAALLVLRAMEGHDIAEDALHGLFDTVHGVLLGNTENLILVGVGELGE